MHFETQFWEILKWDVYLFFSRDHVPCHIPSFDREYLLHFSPTSLRLDDFSNIVAYIL